VRIGARRIGKEAAEYNVGTVTRRYDETSFIDMLKVMGKLHGSDLEIPHLAVEALLMTAQTFSPKGGGYLTYGRFFEDRELVEHIGGNVRRHHPLQFIADIVGKICPDTICNKGEQVAFTLFE